MFLRSSRRLELVAVVTLVACRAPVYEGLGDPDATSTSTGAADTPTSSSTAGPGEPGTAEPTATTTGTTAAETLTAETTAAGDATTAVDSGDPSTSVTGVDQADCGNGHIDPGEQCDDGYQSNSNSKHCTLQCQFNYCGDGLVEEGEESCDHGGANNDTLYNGCTTACVPGPACNDGVRQDPEECDAGDANGSGESPPNSAPCDDGCRFDAKIAFVTSQVYAGGAVGGVEGAHIKCQTLAEQVGLDNHTMFRAWISDAQWSPATHFIHAQIPLVLLDGTRVADDWADLVQNGPGMGIVLDEQGESRLYERVWTGTAPSGKVFDPAQTCMNWSSSSPLHKSRVGRTGVDPVDFMQWQTGLQWTSEAILGCQYEWPLYCFEQ